MVSLNKSKPWLAEGISRATWFRRQKEPGAPDGRTRVAKLAPASVRGARLYSEADLGRSLTAQEKAWDAQLDAIEDKGGVAEWVNEDVGYQEVVRPKQPERIPGSSPGRALTPYQPPRPATPPQSMFAVGGKAGRGLVSQGRGMPLPPDAAAISGYTHAVDFERNATASINLLAKEVADLKGRVRELEQEKTIPSSFNNNLANGLLGLFITITSPQRYE